MPSEAEIDQRLTARITNVEPFLDSASTQQVRIWAELNNPGGRLLPGNTVTLSIYPAESEATGKR
jgi:hypothetical protein